MITLKLTPLQASFLEAALERAMDNEGDEEYIAAYAEVLALLDAAKVAA